MSERWMPKKGETYFYFDPKYFGDVSWGRWGVQPHIDHDLYQNGNCFRTEAEAQAAAEKVKALLLSLHYNETSTANSETLKGTFTECLKKFAEHHADVILQKDRERRMLEQYNNAPEETKLPKLTAEVFDRPDCPEWAKYAAVSKFGCLTFFEEKPVLGNNSFLPLSKNNTTKRYRNESDRWDAFDWQNSLIERPGKETKLPEWCKVGEWFYDHHQHGYDKIIAIEDGSRYCIKTKNKGFFTVYYATENLVPARLRPYNAEEMKALLGKVVTRKDGDSFLVTAYTPQLEEDLCAVDIDDMWVIPDGVLKDYTINNNPCGVLEHLENGEWVE